MDKGWVEVSQLNGTLMGILICQRYNVIIWWPSEWDDVRRRAAGNLVTVLKRLEVFA